MYKIVVHFFLTTSFTVIGAKIKTACNALYNCICELINFFIRTVTDLNCNFTFVICLLTKFCFYTISSFLVTMLKYNKSYVLCCIILLDMLLLKGAILCVVASVIQALYEDQIGLFDWKQSFFGHVSFASFDSTSDGSSAGRSIFVASKSSGAIGALSSKDGSVAWRHLFSSNDQLSVVTSYNDCMLVVAGNVARCFYPDGVLKSQVVLPIGDTETVRLVRSSENSVMFATDNSVCLLRGNTYRCLPISLDTSYFFVGCIDDLSSCIISQHTSGKIEVFQAVVDKEAKVVKLSSGTVNDQLVQCDSLSNNKAFVCRLASGKILGPINFNEFSENLGYIDEKSCRLSSSSPGDVVAIDIKIAAQSMLVTFSNGGKQLCKVHPTFSVHSFQPDSVVVEAASADYDGQTTAFVLLNEGGSNFRMVLLDDSNTELVDSTFTSRRIVSQGVDSLFPIVLKKRGADGSSGKAPILRCLVQTKYDTLIFVQRGAIKWSRDEGLGQAVSSMFFELPLPDYLADIATEVLSKNTNIFMSFARRVKFESDILFSTMFDIFDQVSHGGFGSLLHYHKDVKHSLLHHHINRHTGDGRDVSVELHRDKFGLEKLILVATKPGQVFAIHSLTGVIVWDMLLGDCRPISLVQLRGAAYAGVASMVAVVGFNESSNGQACIVAFDGITGNFIDKTTYSFLPSIARPYVHADPESRITPLLLFAPTQSAVFVYPPSLTDFVYNTAKNVYFHMVTDKDQNHGDITGFQIGKTRSSNQFLSLSKTWSVRLPAGERIVNVAERRADERIYSKAVVLADRTVLYRYINPNLILLITATTPSDRKETEKETLSIYLIDGVSGRFYYQGQHRHARPPISAVNAENFVTYSYWNSQMRRTEIAVVEVFEGKIERNSTVFSSFDYYGPDVPMVLKQAYVLNDIVRSMVITSTRKGITSKSVLVGLTSGRIAEIPKLLLNPRRLLTMTQEHAEEGIPAYIPEIRLHPESFINYNRSLDRITNMYTAASGLESTSLLFVSGMDLYFSRVWPSKMFDMLKEDFDYAFIIMITVGLLAATLVFRYLVHLKEVKKAWQ